MRREESSVGLCLEEGGIQAVTFCRFFAKTPLYRRKERDFSLGLLPAFNYAAVK